MKKKDELEKKIILSSQEYFYLLNALGKTKDTKIQVNNYYDTDDLLMNKSGITCRNRFVDGKYITTIKKHNVANQDKSIEISDTYSNEKHPKNFENMGLKLQGKLITTRTVLIQTDFLNVMLDHNQYLNVEDYELGIEYDPFHEHDANTFIEEVSLILFHAILIPSTYSFIHRQGYSCSKSQRFFHQLSLLMNP